MSIPQIGALAYITSQGQNYVTTAAPAGAGSAIITDASVNWSGTYKGDCTKQPVSDKTDRTDHYRVVNPSFTITGGISSATLSIYPWSFAGNSDTRVGQYVQAVRDIILQKELCSVYMPDGLIANNCVIINAEFSKNAPNGNYMEVSLQIEQLQVIVGTVGIEALASTSSSPNLEGGNQSNQETSASEGNYRSVPGIFGIGGR